MYLNKKFTHKTYIYVLLLAAANFALGILLTIFVSRYLMSEWEIISFDYLLLTIVLLNLLFVLLQWYYLVKNKSIKARSLPSNRFFILGLYIGIIFITILYQFYFGNTPSINSEDLSNQITLILSTIVIVPIIEEFVYREILVKMLNSKVTLNYIDFLYLSILFMLIHIDINSINWLYLGYMFIIGLLLLLIRLINGLVASILMHIVINSIAWLVF